MINYTGSYTDFYQLTMAQVYFLKGKKDTRTVFDYFFRKLPFGGGYAVFAGLKELLDAIEQFRFDEEDILFLKELGFHSDFLEYLQRFRFKGTIYAVFEGEVVFPNCPILSVEANLIEAQLIETLILNILNFQTLIATKARRIRYVAGDGALLMEFGLRRAQGTGGYHASRAAIIGGFDATSNVRSGRDYGLEVSGTMSHSFIQSYDSEIDAFRDFSATWPDNCIFLVDTYDTLASGLPNAIKVAHEMARNGVELKGIRLDSGNLAELSVKARQMLDEAGLKGVKIAVSDRLDEYAIQKLKDQNAPIDFFGVGTSLAVGKPDAALDGVYKLAQAEDKPRIKRSETLSKATLPGKKQIYRILDDAGSFLGLDLITLYNERQAISAYPILDNKEPIKMDLTQKESLLKPVILKGKQLQAPKKIEEIIKYSFSRFNQLPSAYKAIKEPKKYLVGISEQLKETRNELVRRHS